MSVIDLENEKTEMLQSVSTEEAYEFCLDLAKSHYENFPVASILLPRSVRKHVAAVYAFARIADDFADESEFEGLRMARLKDWENQLKAMSSDEPMHPVFKALKATTAEFNIPETLYFDLLTAFKMDVVVSRYQTFDQLLNYCRYSANPIGRLMLYIMGYPAPKFLEYSDYICTALQLANFWQDISVDQLKNRLYLPHEDLIAFQYSEEDLAAKVTNDQFKRLLMYQVERTQDLFLKGKPLCQEMHGRFGLELKLTWLGGMAILDKVRDCQADILTHRPTLSKVDFAKLIFKCFKKPFGGTNQQ